MVLEVDMVEGPQRGIDVEMAANWDSKVRVMKVGGHGTESGGGWRVRA